MHALERTLVFELACCLLKTLNCTCGNSVLEEAYLTDGGCVSSWCKNRVEAVQALLSAGLGNILNGAPVPQACASLTGLVQISGALAESSSGQ